MIEHEYLKNLITIEKKFYSQAIQKYYFPSDISSGLIIDREKDILKMFLDNKEEISDVGTLLEYVLNAYISYASYSLISLDNKVLARECFSIICNYNKLYQEFLTLSNECFNTVPNISQENLCLFLTLPILLENRFSYNSSIEDSLLKILEQQEKDGNEFREPFKFVLALYSEKSFSQKSLSYPYSTIYKEYDLLDLNKVDAYIYILCDMHLELTKEKEFFSEFHTKVFPYEVLFWLKIREMQELKNPSKFEHPLMNTSLVKLFLEKDDFVPMNIEYIEKLILKLNEKCLQTKS